MPVENTTTATYILTFYNDLIQLSNQFAAYKNYLRYLKSKIKNKEITPEIINELIDQKKISAEELTALQELANSIHYWVTQTYLKQMGFAKKIKEIEDAKPELERLCNELDNSLIPSYELVKAYCVLNHELYATSTLNEIIIKTKEYYDKVSGLNESLA